MSSPSPFRPINGATGARPTSVHLSEDAFQFIRQEIEQWKGVETGGVVVGYVEGSRFVITHASGPGPKGRRLRHSVRIDGAYATDYCWDLQRRSDGTVYYLGDWHVHPVGAPYLSTGDRRAAEALVKAEISPFLHVLSIVFAGDIRQVQAFMIDGGGHAAEVSIEIGGPPSWQPQFNRGD